MAFCVQNVSTLYGNISLCRRQGLPLAAQEIVKWHSVQIHLWTNWTTCILVLAKQTLSIKGAPTTTASPCCGHQLNDKQASTCNNFDSLQYNSRNGQIMAIYLILCELCQWGRHSKPSSDATGWTCVRQHVWSLIPMHATWRSFPFAVFANVLLVTDWKGQTLLPCEGVHHHAVYKWLSYWPCQ